MQKRSRSDIESVTGVALSYNHLRRVTDFYNEEKRRVAAEAEKAREGKEKTAASPAEVPKTPTNDSPPVAVETPEAPKENPSMGMYFRDSALY